MLKFFRRKSVNRIEQVVYVGDEREAQDALYGPYTRSGMVLPIHSGHLMFGWEPSSVIHTRQRRSDWWIEWDRITWPFANHSVAA